MGRRTDFLVIVKDIMRFLLKESKQRIKRLFLTDHKQKRHSLVGPPKLWKMKRNFQILFLKEQGLLEKQFLLDIGCGTLRGGIPLIDYLETGHYYGIEARQKALAEARKELAEAGLTDKKPSLVLVEAMRHVDLDQQFDVIWAFSVLIHMTDDTLLDTAGLVSRHLREDGNFYCNVNIGAEKDKTWQGFPVVHRSLDFYTEAFRSHGLQVKDLGRLQDLGHSSGVKSQDEQRMLKIGKFEGVKLTA